VTITEATHALARGPRIEPSNRYRRATPDGSMRLVDAMSRTEPSWVEAVAVVQAVCAQLAPGQAAPALDAITISATGAVSFASPGPADGVSSVVALGQMLSDILRSDACPMQVWEVIERARRGGGTARSLGEALTCFPADQGPHELGQLVAAARRLVPRDVEGHPGHALASPPAAAVKAHGLTARAIFLLLAVVMVGIGAGLSMGTLVVARTSTAPPGLAAMAANQGESR